MRLMEFWCRNRGDTSIVVRKGGGGTMLVVCRLNTEFKEDKHVGIVEFLFVNAELYNYLTLDGAADCGPQSVSMT